MARRKVAGEAQGLVDLAPMVGMAMNGLGGLVAVIGGVFFVWTMAVAMLRRRCEQFAGASIFSVIIAGINNPRPPSFEEEGVSTFRADTATAVVSGTVATRPEPRFHLATMQSC